MQRKLLLLSAMIAVQAFACTAHAIDYYQRGNNIPQQNEPRRPDFSPQWWEVDQNGNPPSAYNPRSKTVGAQGDCQADARAIETLRRRIGDEIKRYTSCLERADERENCGRDFDALKRIQQDHEDAVRELDRNCR